MDTMTTAIEETVYDLDAARYAWQVARDVRSRAMDLARERAERDGRHLVTPEDVRQSLRRAADDVIIDSGDATAGTSGADAGHDRGGRGD